MTTIILENIDVLESINLNEEDLKLLKKKEPSKREVIKDWQD